MTKTTKTKEEIIPKLDPKTDGSSMDVVQSLVDQLRPIVPEAFTEGKIDFDVLRELLGDDVEERQERYSFTWHGKSRARRIAQTPSTGTLRPCPEESVNWDTTKNIFIEGDNLEVLKLLQKSYHKKVKMIYIDPPYNTGKEFIYPDKFQDNLDTYLKYTGQVDEDGLKVSANSETGGRYHTNWLNMMYPRLKLARNLLRDDGVMFVSIDEHEAANLRKMMDDIYGEDNFVANIIWQSRTSISNDQEVSLNHNQTLVFAKSRDSLLFFGEPLDSDEYSNRDNDPRGPWKLVPIDANKPGGNTHYPIKNPKTGEDYLPPNGRSWAINPEEFKRLFDDGRIKFGMSDDSAPKKKLFLKEREAKGDTKTPSSLLLDAGTTKNGTTEMMDLFDGKKVFDYPKPSSFIFRLLNYGLSRTDDNIVLDFFAGSCSTAHACIDWTKSKVQFIAVQLPEEVDPEKPYGKSAIESGMTTIAEIGKERMRRVLKAHSNSDDGFRVFKLSSSNLRKWDVSRADLKDSLLKAEEHLAEGRTEADVVTEVFLKFGLGLTPDVSAIEVSGSQKVYVVGHGALVISLADIVDEEFCQAVVKIRDDLAPEVFRLVLSESGFANDVIKTNAIQMLNQAGIIDVQTL